jgi:hypothetical protein
MAAKRKAQERVPNYPSLFGDELGEALPSLGRDSLSKGAKKARKSPNYPQTGKYRGTGLESREKRNTKLWSLLYPTPKDKK